MRYTQLPTESSTTARPFAIQPWQTGELGQTIATSERAKRGQAGQAHRTRVSLRNCGARASSMAVESQPLFSAHPPSSRFAARSKRSLTQSGKDRPARLAARSYLSLSDGSARKLSLAVLGVRPLSGLPRFCLGSMQYTYSQNAGKSTRFPDAGRDN
jgi:hypothetical protein